MNNNRFSIATITLARDKKEEDVLRLALTQLANLNIQVFVCDGGSGPEFLQFLQNIPQISVVPVQGKGVWQQAKASVQAAYNSGTDFIFYTEPDKLDFFRHALPGFLTGASLAEGSGILLASRTETAFATFPAFQQMTETTINYCCAEITGKSFDYTYGPFILNRKLVPYLKLVQEDVGWGWRPFVFGIAARLGYDIVNDSGNFTCPADQRADSRAERIYRMRQLSQNLQGMVLSTSVVL